MISIDRRASGYDKQGIRNSLYSLALAVLKPYRFRRAGIGRFPFGRGLPCLSGNRSPSPSRPKRARGCKEALEALAGTCSGYPLALAVLKPYRFRRAGIGRFPFGRGLPCLSGNRSPSPSRPKRARGCKEALEALAGTCSGYPLALAVLKPYRFRRAGIGRFPFGRGLPCLSGNRSPSPSRPKRARGCKEALEALAGTCSGYPLALAVLKPYRFRRAGIGRFPFGRGLPCLSGNRSPSPLP